MNEARLAQLNLSQSAIEICRVEPEAELDLHVEFCAIEAATKMALACN